MKRLSKDWWEYSTSGKSELFTKLLWLKSFVKLYSKIRPRPKVTWISIKLYKVIYNTCPHIEESKEPEVKEIKAKPKSSHKRKSESEKPSNEDIFDKVAGKKKKVEEKAENNNHTEQISGSDSPPRDPPEVY